MHIRRKEPRVFAIMRRPDGTLIKREVRRQRDTYKKYDGYIKDAETGLLLKPHLKNRVVKLANTQRAVNNVSMDQGNRRHA